MCGRARGWNEFARCSRNRYFHLKPRVSSLDATYVTRSGCGISDDLSSKELVVTRSTVRKEVEGSTSSTILRDANRFAVRWRSFDCVESYLGSVITLG